MNNNIFKTLYILLSFIILIIVFSVRPPNIEGDGHEYILMSQSFLNHGTPKIVEGDDVRDIVNAFRKEIPSFKSGLLICGNEKDCSNSRYTMSGYFKDKHGDYYSYHFSFLSLVNTPALLLTNYLDKAPTKSFYLTNVLFFLVAVFFILFVLKESLFYRLLLLFFLIGQTTFAYLKWPHPEAMTMSLLIIALCLVKVNKSLPASIVFAFSSLQYPPLGLVAAIVLFYGIMVDVMASPSKKISDIINNRKQLFKYIGYSIVSGTIVLIPSIFYFYHYGVPNIIAVSSASISLISIQRFISLHYDLNQGSILLYPIILVLIPIFAFISLFNIKNKSNRIVILFVILSIISSIPSLTTLNWNAGSVNVMRYSFWISVPLVFAFVEFLLNINNKKILITVAIISIFSQASIYIYQYKEKYFSTRYVTFSPMSMWMFSHFPTIYNPIPEIFIERAFQIDGASKDLFSTKGYPAVVYNGNIMKILVPDGYKLRENLCSNEFNKMVSSFEGYTYINFKNGCKALEYLPDGIVFIK